KPTQNGYPLLIGSRIQRQRDLKASVTTTVSCTLTRQLIVLESWGWANIPWYERLEANARGGCRLLLRARCNGIFVTGSRSKRERIRVQVRVYCVRWLVVYIPSRPTLRCTKMLAER